MPIVAVTCPLDGAELDVLIELRGDEVGVPLGFHLSTSPGFVEHMNAEHGGRMDPVRVWPPE